VHVLDPRSTHSSTASDDFNPEYPHLNIQIPTHRYLRNIAFSVIDRSPLLMRTLLWRQPSGVRNRYAPGSHLWDVAFRN
jgi:hypothetical protein